MSNFPTSDNMKRAKGIAYVLLRLAAGLLFLQHGGMTLFDWFGGIPAAMGGKPALLSQGGIGAMLQFFGGLLVLLGLFTRPVAFILSGEMAVAYFQFHQKEAFWPIRNHGEPAVLFCFIFLYIAAKGGGCWSLDSLICRRRKMAEPTRAGTSE